MRIAPQPLQQLVAAIFSQCGSSAQEAHDISAHLVRANLVGHDSHGVIRTPIYVGWQREGKVHANKQLDIVFDGGALALCDGQLGYGQSIGKQAVELGLKKCREHGAAAIALRNSAHLGRIGHWAEQAADAGCVSLHFVNTSGLGMFVVPAGGIDKRMSVNPVTMGVPVPDRPHVVLDMAAAAAAEGKLKVARNKGVAVPDNWILDADGNPTNDPNEFYGPPMGAILPIAGHKGSGLCFMVEMLACALTGSGCSSPGKTLLEQGMLSIFIDQRQMPLDDFFGSEVTRYIDFVKSSRTATGDGEILVPGEVEARNERERRELGIELDDTTIQQIVDTASAADVEASLIDAVNET